MLHDTCYYDITRLKYISSRPIKITGNLVRHFFHFSPNQWLLFLFQSRSWITKLPPPARYHDVHNCLPKISILTKSEKTSFIEDAWCDCLAAVLAPRHFKRCRSHKQTSYSDPTKREPSFFHGKEVEKREAQSHFCEDYYNCYY